ncbi:hypothetical protein BDY19DRAFT_873659, partial [Irpex rosettiformis]
SPRTLSRRKPRKPSKTNSIASSSLRPPVLACDRLSSWTTPFAQRFHADLSTQTSSKTVDSLSRVMLASLESNTRKNYGAGLLRFNQYCDCFDVAEDLRMPASDTLLASFIAEWGGVVSRSTIDTWIAGLSFWHTLNGAPWLGGRMLKATCSGALKLQPGRKPKRPPVTIEHLTALLNHLDLKDSFDVAVFAVACFAFWGTRRLGELVIPSLHGFDSSKHVARNANSKFCALPDNKEFFSLTLPWSKTTKFAGAVVTVTENHEPTSPIRALRHHLKRNSKVPSHAPFFAFEAANKDGWAPMTRNWFLERVNEVWLSAGLDQLTGHCFRIGGATELLLRGTPPDIVAVQGGWRSRAFLEYWRKIDSILPLFISNSFDKSRLQLTKDSMDDFRKR